MCCQCRVCASPGMWQHSGHRHQQPGPRHQASPPAATREVIMTPHTSQHMGHITHHTYKTTLKSTLNLRFNIHITTVLSPAANFVQSSSLCIIYLSSLLQVLFCLQSAAVLQLLHNSAGSPGPGLDMELAPWRHSGTQTLHSVMVHERTPSFITRQSQIVLDGSIDICIDI